MADFQSVSIIICVIDETEQLNKTVEFILSSCRHDDIGEILIVSPKDATDNCKKAVSDIQKGVLDISIKPILQKYPGLGGALKEAFDEAECSHIIGLPADFAIDLSCVPILIDKAKKNPDMIYSTSRWLIKGSFYDYNKVKLIFNYISQKFLSLLFRQKLTDMTNPVQIAPSETYKSICWEESGFAILLEMILKPIRVGCKFIEIPTACYQRNENKPQKPIIKTMVSYLKLAIHIRFMKKSDILRKG